MSVMYAMSEIHDMRHRRGSSVLPDWRANGCDPDASLERPPEATSNRFRLQGAAAASPVFLPDQPELTRYDGKVAILLTTRNGAEFLADQLASYRDQTHRNWELFVSDDGSTDQTRTIVKSFAESVVQNVWLRPGPCQGFQRNFMSMAADTQIDAEFFAFSDQDDIWSADKLERGVNWLESIPQATAAVYCGRTELVDRNGVHQGYSRGCAKRLSFQNALVQNVGGGNTMMFNRATKKLLETTASAKIASHDWWTYQVTTATGGVVHFDPQPCLKYRQHDWNLVGTNCDAAGRLRRALEMFSGRLVDWNEGHINALQKIRPLLHPSSLATIDCFAEARKAPLFRRLRLLRQAGVYRQGLLDNFGLIVACIFRRI
jgi:Glycosyl transferase family 2